MGLAENSKDNPLKILHFELDEIYDNDIYSIINNKKNDNDYYNFNNNKISFVGISNYNLDYSKLNRAIILYRNDLDNNDLIETAKEISVSLKVKENVNIIKKLADVYSKYKMKLTNEIYKDFHSQRDFYFLIKNLCQKIKNNPLINYNEILGLCFIYLNANFSGLNKQLIKDYVSIIDIFSQEFKCVIYEKFNLKNAIINNIKNIDSRYLLLISNSSTSDFLLEYILKKLNKYYSIFIGSKFSNDLNQKSYSLKIINKIISNIEFGNFIIFKNLDIIYSYFYDLFNLHFHYLNEDTNKKYVKLSIGMINIPRLFINNNFRCAIIINDNEVYNKDPPFLNRFEKYIISFNIFLNENEQKICEKINDKFNFLFTCNNKNIKCDFDLNKMKINFGKEEIYGLFYKVKEDIKKNKNEISTSNINYQLIEETIIKILCNNLSQDIIIYSKYSNLPNDFLQIIYKNYNLKVKNNLKEFLLTLKTRKNIIYTFTSETFDLLIEDMILSFNNIILNKNNVEEYYISTFQSQFDVEETLINFYENNNHVLFLRFGITQFKHLNHIISLIENLEKEMNVSLEKKNKTIIFIVNIKRFFYNEKKTEENYIKENDSISNLTEYNQILIDNLYGESIKVYLNDIINSNDKLLLSLNLEENYKILFNKALNSLKLKNKNIENKENVFKKIKELLEKYILSLKEPIKAFLNESNISNKTIDLLRDYLNYIKIQCQKYITFILINLYESSLINYYNNSSKEIDLEIELLLNKNINLENIEIDFESNYIFKNNIYEIPYIDFYFHNLNDIIINNSLIISFIQNEHFLSFESKENVIIKDEYISKKNNILQSLLNESKSLIDLNMKYKFLLYEKSVDKFKKDFSNYFLLNNQIIILTEEIFPLINYILDLICISYKFFSNIEETNLNLIIYCFLWFESYKKSFLNKFFRNLILFSQFCGYNLISIKEQIKELIDKNIIFYQISKKNPEMKKLSNEIIFLLNESFLFLLNKCLTVKNLYDIQFQKINEIYLNCKSFQSDFNLYGKETWKFKINILLYENLNRNDYNEVIKIENNLNEQNNINIIKEEVLKLKTIKLKKQSFYNNNTFIIKLLMCKYKLFESIIIRDNIFKIILKDENLLINSKGIFNLVLSDFVNFNPFNEDDYVISSNEKQRTYIEKIEKEEKSNNSEIIYRLLIMDIFSKFILNLFFNNKEERFNVLKQFIEEINSIKKEEKDLYYYYKIEYIKIYFFFISKKIIDNKYLEKEEIRNFIQFVNNNNLKEEVKIYLIKCIKFRLNDSFSNLENYKGPINWVKNFIENQKSKYLYLPMKTIYINFEEKYQIMEKIFREYETNKNSNLEFLNDDEDNFAFAHYFYNEKACFLFKNKENNIIKAKIIEEDKIQNLSINTKNLINSISQSVNNYSDEEISLFILFFNIWSYFSEFYKDIINNNTINSIKSFKIEEKEENYNHLIFNFFLLSFQHVITFIEAKKILIDNQIKKIFNELTNILIKNYKINNVYCLIYYLLSKKYDIKGINEPIEFIRDFIYIALNEIKDNNIYESYYVKYTLKLDLKYKNPRFQINEMFNIQINQMNNSDEILFLFKQYIKPKDIINKCIENKKDSLITIYHNENNQKLFEKIKILITKIKPLLGSLNKIYSNKITKGKAINLTLEQVIRENHLQKEFNDFKEGLNELEINEISQDISLINLLFQDKEDNKYNKFNLFKKVNSLIDDFNKIRINNKKVFEKIINNEIHFFDITSENIIPTLNEEEKENSIFYDNLNRIIIKDKNNDNYLNFSLYSNLNFDYEKINEIYYEKYKNYLWKIPKVQKFIFCFDDEVYNLINSFYSCFPLKEISNEEQNEIKMCLNDKFQPFQFLCFIIKILNYWKKNNKFFFQKKLIDEIILLEKEINEVNIYKKFFEKLNFDTEKILLIYEYIEDKYYKSLIDDNISKYYKKKIDEKSSKKILEYFKDRENEKKKFMKILRIFILRFLISIPLFSLNLNLIKSLISMNNNLSFDDSYKWLKNNKIKLTIENSVKFFYLLKENNFLQKKHLI